MQPPHSPLIIHAGNYTVDAPGRVPKRRAAALRSTSRPIGTGTTVSVVKFTPGMAPSQGRAGALSVTDGPRSIGWQLVRIADTICEPVDGSETGRRMPPSLRNSRDRWRRNRSRCRGRRLRRWRQGRSRRLAAGRRRMVAGLNRFAVVRTGDFRTRNQCPHIAGQGPGFLECQDTAERGHDGTPTLHDGTSQLIVGSRSLKAIVCEIGDARNVPHPAAVDSMTADAVAVEETGGNHLLFFRAARPIPRSPCRRTEDRVAVDAGLRLVRAIAATTSGLSPPAEARVGVGNKRQTGSQQSQDSTGQSVPQVPFFHDIPLPNQSESSVERPSERFIGNDEVVHPVHFLVTTDFQG